MKDQKLKKQDKGKMSVNVLAAAVTGVVIGAGIAATGVILADEKNRDKVKKTLLDVKNQVVEYAEGVKDQVVEKKKEIEREFAENKEKVRMVVSSAKDSVDKTTKEVNKAVKSI